MIIGINQEGRLQGYKIRASYPQGTFDNYAAAALKQWRWQPTASNSKRMPVLTSIRLDFKLSQNPKNDVYLENCLKLYS